MMLSRFNQNFGEIRRQQILNDRQTIFVCKFIDQNSDMRTFVLGKKVANDSEMGAILTVIWVEILIIIKNT